jgi:hypothetical protein
LEYSLPFNILFGIALSSILSTCPDHLILCDLIYCDVLPKAGILKSLVNGFAKHVTAATEKSVTNQRLARLDVFQQ